MNTTPLTQEELNKLATSKGMEKKRAQWRDAKERGREALTKVGNIAVRRIANALMDLLADDLEALACGRAVVGGAGIKPLKDAPIAKVCLAVARAAVNGMTNEWIPGITMQARLGAAAEDGILEAMWEKFEPHQAEAVRALIGARTDPKQKLIARRAYLLGWASELEAHGPGWDELTTKTVGASLMQYLVRAGMFDHKKELRGEGARKKWTNGARLTEQAKQWISDAVEFDAASSIVQYPTVDRPIPWTAPLGGGFHGRGELDHPSVPSSQRPFCILRHARKEHKALLARADLTTVYAALNAAQDTPWRINPRVFEVFRELRRIGKGEAGLALADVAEKPPYPEEAKINKDAHEKFLRERTGWYANEAKMIGKRKAEHHLFGTAEMFSGNERFHFVYNVDFRGRAYACSDYLSPQGGDLQRGLLEFADGDPLTEDGLWWLKLHLANCYGLDKESHADRIAWADENTVLIRKIAFEPLDTVRLWEKADEPWQFLAACFAWDDYEKGEPVCRLPVVLDGSCSGIQHSAALVADREAGARVNLVPRQANEKPADIYADVAERTNELLKDGETRLDLHAHHWLQGWKVTRSDTKSSVMTLPYGGTKFGNGDKVRKSVEKQIKKGKKERPIWLDLSKPNREDYKAAMGVLSEAVWEAMGERIKVPLLVMDYFRACARALQKREAQLQRQEQRKGREEGGPHLRFTWTSPCGFPVLTDYRKQKNRRTEIKDEETGKALSFEYYADSLATDWKRVVDRAPPHFIHSLDASHLMRVLERAKDVAGIDRISIVHDAFGTTPSKAGALAQLLRDEFVRMYAAGGVLEATLGKSLEAAGAEVPVPPERGTLNISEIGSSRYLFS